MVLGYLDALPPPYTYRFVPAGHPRPGSTTPPARPTTRRTKARATGRSTPRTPPRSPATPSSPGSGRCARRRRSSPRASRSSPRSPGVRASWSGAPVSASNGHLVVIVGFTASGDPVVNDPAAKTAAGVRHVTTAGVRERLAAEVRRRGLRHPRRRPPAAGRAGGPTGSSATLRSPVTRRSWPRPLRLVTSLRPAERMRKARGNLSPLSTYNAPGPCGKTLLVADNLRSCPPAADWS